MKRVLVLEDDSILSSGLRQALEGEGYEVLCAMDGENGLHLAKTTSPDLMILDLMMPLLNGFEVITELRRQGDSVPVIILSARTETRDKIRGLDLGADDYMVKPFDLNELLARVRRHLNRRQEKTQAFGEFHYEWKTRTLFSGAAQNIQLTSKERKLLEFFLKHEGQIVTRTQLLDEVWGDDYDGTDRTVDNVIMSVRKKLHAAHLQTERGIGYRFVTKL